MRFQLKVMNTEGINRIFRSTCRVFFMVAMAAAFLVEPAAAQSNDQASFGIRPTKSYEGKPETSAYFSYDSQAGSVINDEALVLNDGQVPVTLKIFAADGITAQNGGTSLIAPDDPGAQAGEHVSDWISLSTTQVTLQPGEEVKVPFTVTIPADALPGEHIGGLMVESVTDSVTANPSDGDQAQFSVNVVKRVGVAVVIDLPGVHTSMLVVDQIGFETQDEQGATFAIKVNNIGNVMTKAEGNFMLTDKDGATLASLPVKVDTILPGDATTIYLFEPLNLADGDYFMSVGLIYDGGTAILEGIELRIRQGEAITGDTQALNQGALSLTPAVQNIRPAASNLSRMWLTVQENQVLTLAILLGVGLLFILVMGYLVWRKRAGRKDKG